MFLVSFQRLACILSPSTFRVTFFLIVYFQLCWVIGFRENFSSSRDSKGRNSQPWCVFPIQILPLFSGTQSEPAVQMCSTAGQQCVFPFTYKGKTLNLRTCSLYGIVWNTESTVKISFFGYPLSSTGTGTYGS
jgi:hypothetical protein